jgi:ATP-binding cassette, subfamily B, multidrug efflux pump
MKSFYLIKPYFIEKKWIVLSGLFALLVVDILQLIIPRIIKWVIDDLTLFRATAAGLFRYALYVVAVASLIGVFRFVWRHCLIGTSRRIEEGIRNRLLAHIQTLSCGYFDETKTGDLMAHVTNDVQHVRMAVGMGMVALTDAVVLGLAAIGFMLYINVSLTLFSLLPMPIIVVLARVATRRMHRLYKEVQAGFADLTEIVRERFSGIRVIKAYNREATETERVSALSKSYAGKNLRLVRITGCFFPGMVFFSNLSVALVLYWGGFQAISLTITPGDFVAFLAYLGLLTWPMMAMGWVVNLIQRGGASLDRIERILKTRPQIVDSPNPRVIPSLKGKVVFDDVVFRYHQDLPPVLKHVSLSINPGQTLGVVGPTGTGKTTLCHLVPRLLDVTAGRLLIDGIDIREIPLKVLRTHMAVVPQDAFLFSGTIRDNLCFAREDASEAELVVAVKAARLYDTIMEFPRRFETVVGEKGVILSGGQRQRLALARALLLSVPILILDDPLSQVDTETAAGILDNVRRLSEDQTTIMVSHRISHVKHADNIVVLQHGQVDGVGTHEQLMDKEGFYSNMFHWQEMENGYGREA